jgi:WD40 repeat protein
MLVWKGHTAKVRSLAFAPDGQTIATTAGNSKFVCLWEATTGKLIGRLAGPHSATRTAAFFPNGEHIIALHSHRQASVWHFNTKSRVALETTTWLHPDTAAISPDGSRLVLFTSGRFAEWDDPTRPDTLPRRCDRYHSPPAGFNYPFQMGFSPGGTYYWAAGLTLVLLEPTSFALRRTLTDDEGASATNVGFSTDDSRVCVAFGHRATIFRLDDTRANPVKLRGHKQQVRTVGFLPGGNLVLTAAMDGTVRIWNADTGTEERAFEWGIGKVRVAAISPDGTMCAAGSDEGRLVVWDVDL